MSDTTDTTTSKEVARLTDLPLSPNLPNSRELASLERMASAYSAMPGLNPSFKGKPEAVLAALLTAHSLDLPINPVIVNQFYEVNGRLFPSSQILIALASRQGVEVWFDGDSDDKVAIAYCQRRGMSRVHSYRFTIEMAQKAGLAGKDVWKQHAEVMLRYRAVSRLLRTVAADVVLGIPNEIVEPEHGIEIDREKLQAQAVEVSDDDITDGEVVE